MYVQVWVDRGLKAVETATGEKEVHKMIYAEIYGDDASVLPVDGTLISNCPVTEKLKKDVRFVPGSVYYDMGTGDLYMIGEDEQTWVLQ